MVGTRFHTGSWAEGGGWGTIMRTNLDEHMERVSYDVFMDNGSCEQTVAADEIARDVEYGRTLKGKGGAKQSSEVGGGGTNSTGDHSDGRLAGNGDHTDNDVRLVLHR